MVRDRVEKLRPEPVRKRLLELVNSEPVVVEGDSDDVGFEALEGHDPAQVSRRLDDDRVAIVDEGLPDELERLDRAARQQELVVGRPPALEPLEPTGDEVTRTGEARRRRVLEGGSVPLLDELAQEIGDDPAREGGRVGQPTGEGDDVFGVGEREDGDETLSRARARPRGEEGLPSPELLLDGHGADSMEPSRSSRHACSYRRGGATTRTAEFAGSRRANASRTQQPI